MSLSKQRSILDKHLISNQQPSSAKNGPISGIPFGAAPSGAGAVFNRFPLFLSSKSAKESGGIWTYHEKNGIQNNMFTFTRI